MGSRMCTIISVSAGISTQTNCLRPFLATQSAMVYLWQEDDTIPDCVIRTTPWPCKLCGNDPLHTVRHSGDADATSILDTATRVCNDCYENARNMRLWPGTKILKVSDTNAYPKSKTRSLSKAMLMIHEHAAKERKRRRKEESEKYCDICEEQITTTSWYTLRQGKGHMCNECQAELKQAYLNCEEDPSPLHCDCCGKQINTTGIWTYWQHDHETWCNECVRELKAELAKRVEADLGRVEIL